MDEFRFIGLALSAWVSLSLHATELKITTYNVGYLDVWGINQIWVPDYNERLEVFQGEFLSYLESEKPDVVSLQEVWREDAARKIRSLAREKGYLSVAELIESPTEGRKSFSPYDYENHGLDILVREDSIDSIKGFDFIPFVRKDGSYIRAWITGFIPGVVRGAMKVQFRKGEEVVEVYNSHFTPVINATYVRDEQVEAFSAVLSRSFDQRSADIVIVAADLNFSEHFAFSLDGREKEGTEEEWKKNSELYWKLIGLTQLQDSYRIAHPDRRGYTQDRVNNDLADISDSTRKEPEQRIDYVLFRTTESSLCSVKESKLIFTEPVERNGVILRSAKDPTKRLFLSDHFGVQSTLECL